MHLITENIEELRALCAKYKVRKLYVFGSVLTARFDDNSDIDLSVIFNDADIDDMFIHFFDFVDELQALFNRKVDLVDETAISNHIFQQNLNATKQLLYG
jgi:predicted nucleotidyltransferase